MKKAILMLLLAATVASAQEFVTLYSHWNWWSGVALVSVNLTNSLRLEPGQTAEPVTYQSSSFNGGLFYRLGNSPRWLNVPLYRPNNDAFNPPFVITGPADIQTRAEAIQENRDDYTVATLKITPGRFDPSKTVIVLPGPEGGANVNLECSTNLTDWAVATNGTYIGLPAAKFFRIRVDRIQP